MARQHNNARRREQAMARRSLALAGLLAIGIGWAGSIFPSAPAQVSLAAIGMSDYDDEDSVVTFAASFAHWVYRGLVLQSFGNTSIFSL